jgi:hypothetical protein
MVPFRKSLVVYAGTKKTTSEAGKREYLGDIKVYNTGLLITNH